MLQVLASSQVATSVSSFCTQTRSISFSGTRVPLRHSSVSYDRRSSERSARINQQTTTCAFAKDAMNTVKLVVQGRNLPVTPSIKEYAENKVNKVLHHFEGSIKEVDMTFSATGNKAGQAHHQRNQKAEVTVYTLRHGVIRVEDTEDDLYAAIDLVTDKLKRKMSKLKEKSINNGTWPGRGGPKGGPHIEDFLADDSDSELPINEISPGPQPEIVREKVLMLSNENKMSPEEAMDQLEGVGHDFFVFVDANDGQLKVLYRRISHGYGLLIPQVEQ